jgi:hypothetical protein
MLTPSQCRKYLDHSQFVDLSDEEVIAVRDTLYALAELALDVFTTQGAEPEPSKI